MNLTKKIIIETFLKLCENTPIDKISVSQIIKEAGISKPTFYNHFLDKYDLIAYIFIKDVKDSSTTSHNRYSIEELTNTLTYLNKKRNFYKKALSINTQNSLNQIIHKHNMTFNSESIKKYYNITELDNETLFALKYHSYGCIGYIIEWLKEENPISPEELALLEFKYMPELLRKAWSKK